MKKIKSKYFTYILGGTAVAVAGATIISPTVSIITKIENHKTNSNKISEQFKDNYFYNTTLVKIEKIENKEYKNGTLGITLPKDLLGTKVTYSHP